MWLIHETDLRIAEIKDLPKLARLGDRPVRIRSFEGVGEAEPELLEDIFAAVDGDWAADCLRDRPQLIDAVTMIAMRMGNDDAFKASNVGGQKLLAKVRPAVDQHPLAGTFDEDRAP